MRILEIIAEVITCVGIFATGWLVLVIGYGLGM